LATFVKSPWQLLGLKFFLIISLWILPARKFLILKNSVDEISPFLISTLPGISSMRFLTALPLMILVSYIFFDSVTTAILSKSTRSSSISAHFFVVVIVRFHLKPHLLLFFLYRYFEQ
jgi:hypothetical protein